MATVIDTLITRLRFDANTRDLNRAQARFDAFKARTAQTAAAIGRGVKVGTTALAGIGAIAFLTGSPTERELLKLRTQLGMTADQMDDIRKRARGISETYKTPLTDTTAALFSLLSAGLSVNEAQEALIASAKGWQAQMGGVRDLAHIAGGAVNAYGSDVITGSRAMEIMNATVREGNLEAEDLLRGFGELLQVAPLLGIEMEQLGAIIAGGTRGGVKANIVMTQLRQILFGILRPTETAKKQFEAAGISIRDFQTRAAEDLIGALRWLRAELGDDTEAFARMFESQEAVGLIMDITGRNASAYREILNGVANSTGVLDEASKAYAESGIKDAESGTNKAKLALESLYTNAIVPLLGAFGELPDAVQLAAVAFFGAAGASSLLGISLGPVLLGLIAVAAKVILVVGALALLGIGIGHVITRWDDLESKALEVLTNIADWIGDKLPDWLGGGRLEDNERYRGAQQWAKDIGLWSGESEYQNPLVQRTLREGSDAHLYQPYFPEGFDAQGRRIEDNRDQSINVTYGEGAIVVNAEKGQSPDEIAQAVTRREADQLRTVVADNDSGILR